MTIYFNAEMESEPVRELIEDNLHVQIRQIDTEELTDEEMEMVSEVI